MAVKKTTKRPGLVIYSYLKDGALTAVKGNARSTICYRRYNEMGTISLKKRYMKG